MDAENATVLSRGTLKIKSCLDEENENTGIRCSEPRKQILPFAHDDEQQQQAAAATATAV